MGITKTEGFTDRQIEMAVVAKALGHPARMAIVDYLLKKNACICQDLVDELPLAQATISQHLKALKEAGIIKGEIEGPAMCYCVDEKMWKRFAQHIALYSDRLQKNKCC